MIKSFKCKETEKIWNEEYSRKIPSDIQKAALKKLMMIEYADCLSDLRNPPKNCLETLKGDRLGQHSIRINDQWRICFKWAENNAFEVEIVDYH